MEPTKKDRAEFEVFCQQASQAQLDAIVDKERAAGRRAYLDIAKRVREDRFA